MYRGRFRVVRVSPGVSPEVSPGRRCDGNVVGMSVPDGGGWPAPGVVSDELSVVVVSVPDVVALDLGGHLGEVREQDAQRSPAG